MLKAVLEMKNLTKEAIEKEDSSIASGVFAKDDVVDEINHASASLIADFIETHPGSALSGIFVSGVIRKLERYGDHCTNIAEELIFYLDAKVMKHLGKVDQSLNLTDDNA